MPFDCPACGQTNPQPAGFCLACGRALSTGQRLGVRLILAVVVIFILLGVTYFSIITRTRGPATPTTTPTTR
jgi:hypothetical protein